MKTIVVFFCTCPLDEPNLRHVETDVLIPKLMREKAKERCAEKVEGMSTYFMCRDSFDILPHLATSKSKSQNQLHLSDMLYTHDIQLK